MKKRVIRIAAAAAALSAGAILVPTAAYAAPTCAANRVCVYEDGEKVAQLRPGQYLWNDIAFDEVVNATGRDVTVRWRGSVVTQFGYEQAAAGRFTVAAGGSQSIGGGVTSSAVYSIR